MVCDLDREGVMVLTSTGSGWYRSSEETQICHEVDFHGWVTAGVEDLAGQNGFDGHFGDEGERTLQKQGSQQMS